MLLLSRRMLLLLVTNKQPNEEVFSGFSTLQISLSGSLPEINRFLDCERLSPRKKEKETKFTEMRSEMGKWHCGPGPGTWEKVNCRRLILHMWKESDMKGFEVGHSVAHGG
ncbi:hypothetical protein GE21DRAFT_1306258 [Neurospora crassa]|uniref:Uncharacterized protein B21O8.065 n=1 Tax=Neurospora crassa TaxID=5141 RepID=Q96U64_NEUCS|nr:hypothetical protein GE21DRAFT_1306258 [Neurospora crassa]CAD11340.1 hypothetical protein [Neurospora crassa]